MIMVDPQLVDIAEHWSLVPEDILEKEYKKFGALEQEIVCTRMRLRRMGQSLSVQPQKRFLEDRLLSLQKESAGADRKIQHIRLHLLAAVVNERRDARNLDEIGHIRDIRGMVPIIERLHPLLQTALPQSAIEPLILEASDNTMEQRVSHALSCDRAELSDDIFQQLRHEREQLPIVLKKRHTY